MSYASPVPQLGLGTFGRTGADGLAALMTAIEIGYRHFDTAQSYGTEANVGAAIRRSGLSREAFFVTTKVADTNLAPGDFMPSVERSLETLAVDTVDLLLIHWPSEGGRIPLEAYMPALLDAKARGHARLVGVSNFPIALLDRSETLIGRDAIATNQVELHPYLQAPKLAGHAARRGIMLTAYQPLAKGEAAKDPLLRRIGETHGVTASAVALAFLMAEGHAVIPASGSEANLRANFAAQGVTLSAGEIEAIRGLDRGHRRIDPAKAPRWDD